MSKQHEFAVGQTVIVTGGTTRDARLDRIVRETATRWYCESGRWFGKNSLQGPRPKSMYDTPEYMHPGNDPVRLRSMFRSRLWSAVTQFERQIKSERTVDTAAARVHLAAINTLLNKLDSVASE